jgi:hypothetical protein
VPAGHLVQQGQVGLRGFQAEGVQVALREAHPTTIGRGAGSGGDSLPSRECWAHG